SSKHASGPEPEKEQNDDFCCGMKVVCRYSQLCLKLVDDNTLLWIAPIDAFPVPGELTLARSGIGGNRRRTGCALKPCARRAIAAALSRWANLAGLHFSCGCS